MPNIFVRDVVFYTLMQGLCLFLDCRKEKKGCNFAALFITEPGSVCQIVWLGTLFESGEM